LLRLSGSYLEGSSHDAALLSYLPRYFPWPFRFAEASPGLTFSDPGFCPASPRVNAGVGFNSHYASTGAYQFTLHPNGAIGTAASNAVVFPRWARHVLTG
jgi:hypothetical protein